MHHVFLLETPGAQRPAIPHQHRCSNARTLLPGDEERLVQGDAACVGTAGELLLSRVPSQPSNVETPLSHITNTTPNCPYAQSPVPPSRDPSASKNLLMPPGNAARSSSAIHRPTKSHNPAFLPTPPPEPHSSLPRCPIPEFDFRDFQRRDVYPYGVETPGLVHSGEDDYFGK